MERFIAALDLQEQTALVVQKAAEMAAKFDAELHLVHVISPIGSYIGTTFTDPLGGIDTAILPNELELIETQKNAARENMEMIAQPLSLRPAAIKIFLGDIEDEVLNYAREIKAGMIIIGTHQNSGLSRLFSRETSVKMLHETQIPILVIPTNSKPADKS